MSAWAFAPAWLEHLAWQGRQAPERPRLPLLWQGQVVGSVEPRWLQLLLSAGGARFFRQENNSVFGLARHDADWAELAALMRQMHLGGPWRDELLAIKSDAGALLGLIERGAVRPLALATEAVHLIGCTPDGRVWVQQRSLSKPNDPGLLDTLMGGMVTAADGVAGALERETWEEAGLHLAQLQDLRDGGQVPICKPSPDGQGMGYLRETLHWSICTVPEGVLPCNQDGEVEGFELLWPSEVVQRLEAGCFTTEAALVLVAAFA